MTLNKTFVAKKTTENVISLLFVYNVSVFKGAISEERKKEFY